MDPEAPLKLTKHSLEPIDFDRLPLGAARLDPTVRMVQKLKLIGEWTVLCAMTQENKRDSTLFWIEYMKGREIARLQVP